KFWLRRVRRLLPAVSVLTVVFAVTYAVAASSVHDVVVGAISLGGIVTYTFNWAGVLGHAAPWQIDHLWSLAVEEQFYLLWPIALFFVLRRGMTRRTLLRLTAAACVLSALGRLVYFTATHDLSAAYNATPFRADGLLLGCLIGELWTWRVGEHWFRRIASSWVSYIAPFVVLAIIAVTTGNDSHRLLLTYDLGFALAALSAGVLVAALVGRQVLGGRQSRVERFLRSPLLVAIGLRSYSIYLWQNFVMWALNSRFHGTPLWLPVNIIVTLAAAEISYRFVEQRFLKPRPAVPMPDPTETASPPAEADSTPADSAMPEPAHGRRASVQALGADGTPSAPPGPWMRPQTDG
ncbi:MAG TPA: acyltransferase family protein, partial [Acidimicrobiales bacterium]